MTFAFADGFFMVNELPDGRCWCFPVDFLWILGWDCSRDYYCLKHLLDDEFPLYLAAHKHMNNFHILHLYVYHCINMGRNIPVGIQSSWICCMCLFFKPTLPSVCCVPAFIWMLSSDLRSMFSLSFEWLHYNFSWMIEALTCLPARHNIAEVMAFFGDAFGS